MKQKLLFALTCLLTLSAHLSALDIDGEKYYVIMARNDHSFFVKDLGETNIRVLQNQDYSTFWHFIPTGNSDCYYIQNLLTGRYAQQVSPQQGTLVEMGDEPVEYKVLETPGEGIDVFGITSTNISNTSFTNGSLGWNWRADGNVMQSYAAAVGTNHRSFFYLEEANPPSCLIGSHDYDNGICSICGLPDKNYLETDAEGFYHLTSAKQIEWFSAIVNTGSMSICAKLDNDIDFTGIEHTPIANVAERKYNGTFDGQGHRISNLVMNYPDQENIGLFGFLRGNDGTATVRNLIIDKSCSFTGAHRVAAITGCSQGQGGLVTLENIVTEANVTATTGSDAGALIGGQINNAPQWRIRNCVNTGKISSNGYAGMVAGWMGNNANSVIENIINIGIIEGFDKVTGTNLGRFAGTTSNLVDLSGTEGATQGIVDELTAEDIASGKLTYYMNGTQENINFYQTLGEDDYPVPFSTHSQVFFKGEMLCDGSPTGEGTYTNDETATPIPPHTYADGDFYCLVCGHINENFCQNIDGVYQLTNGRDIEWFAAFVNAGNSKTDAVLTDDIDMSDVDAFEGIGNKAQPYIGHFDGQHHRISNLEMKDRDYDWSGFFNFTSGGVVIENIMLDYTCFISGAKGTALVGGCGSGGDVLFRNLGNEGDVTSSAANAAGILGCNFQSGCKVTLLNCYSTGIIKGANESAAIAGWLGNNGAIMSNCWSSASVTGIQNQEKYIARHDNGVLSNNYSIYGNQGQRFEEYEIETGALAYRLSTALESPVWFQNLDNGQPVDELPTTDPTHGAVYPVAEMLCDGTIGGDATYSNSNEVVIPPHQFVDGFCIVCHQEDPDYPFLRLFANADHEVAGGYVNDQSNDGSGLAINNHVAEHWNQQYFDSYQPITGLQKGIYKVRVQGYSRICKWGALEAYDDGVLKEDMAPLYHNSQYYAEVNGKRVANLFQDIAEYAQEESLGGGEENYSDVTGLWVPNSLAAANRYFAKGLYWNTPLYFYVNSEDDEVRIGLENRIYLQGNWTVWDTWRLEYVGEPTEDNINLIREQQEGNIQELETLKAQVALEEAYLQAEENLNNATTLTELLNVSHELSTLPQQIRLSHLAYKDYADAVTALREEVEGRNDLNGTYAELLDTYLYGSDDPSTDLPNGSFEYILAERLLDNNGLSAEIEFLQNLYAMAVRTSLTEGSDLTNLIVNPGMDEDANFTGWQKERTKIGNGDNNLSCRTGYEDIYFVSGSLNSAFRVWQDLEEGLPNGIYEIQIPAYYRPGPKGSGNYDGTDIVSADIFINDYHTPVMNIYKDEIPYSQAINGVNCRYDSSGDPSAPHNGQDTGSQDYNTGTGYVPDQRPASSFAFSAGRYVNHAYAIVEDGKLTIGVRNTDVPWYPGGLAVWGKFQLIYHGKSLEAMEQMTQNFESRLGILKLAKDEQDFYISTSHIERLESLIAQAGAASDTDNKIELLKQINDKFNAISESYYIYSELNSLASYCFDEGDKAENSDEYYDVGDEIGEHVYSGDLTDEDANDYILTLMENEAIGGGLYAQGDLLNEDGTKFDYNARNSLYHLTSLGDGKFEGVFRTQNRANLANADNRAGLYFTILNRTYRAADNDQRFVTPKNTEFTIVHGSGADFQMTGGEFKATVDIKAGTIKFEAIEYNWNDRVFVCGSVYDHNGDKHRWVNDEAVSLYHEADGLYKGFVAFFEDPNVPGFASFCIMSSRSTLNDVPYATAKRSNWTEGRYAGIDPETQVVPDESCTELVRGKEQKWTFAWDESYGEKKFFEVVFDMNEGTMLLQSLTPDQEDDIREVANEELRMKNEGIYDLSGRRMNAETTSSLRKGIYIIGGKKVLVK